MFLKHAAGRGLDRKRWGIRATWVTAAAAAVGLGVVAPLPTVVAQGTATGTTSAASPSQSPPQTPSPQPSREPSPDPTGHPPPSSSPPASRPTPGASASPKPSPKPTPPARDDEKRRKKKRKKKRPPVADMAVVYEAAERQLATAQADVGRAKRELAAARQAVRAAAAEVERLRRQAVLSGSRIEPARPALRGLGAALIPPSTPESRDADEVGVVQRGPFGSALTAFGPPSGGAWDETGRTAAARSTGAQSVDSGAAPRVDGLPAAEEAKRRADERLARAEAAMQLVQMNIATARAILGLADGSTTPEAAARRFSDYPVGDCSFPGVTNPSDCKEAQRWAIAQTINPMKDWYYLCLGFVTNAYGHSSGHPTAISHWNALPSELKHPPNTVAPPGALMFWGPNHVALSLGNNVLISTDVLGSGRVWIVDFATIQSIWHFPYLGWAEPDFTH